MLFGPRQDGSGEVLGTGGFDSDGRRQPRGANTQDHRAQSAKEPATGSLAGVPSEEVTAKLAAGGSQ